jgi:hypothetical protein
MKTIFIWLSLLFIPTSFLSAKILILTHSFNKPEFIPWQYHTFKKFLKDDYEFVVFNDAPNRKLNQQIHETCSHLGVSCIDVPQAIHQPPFYLQRDPHTGGPSAECAETIQYMLDMKGFDYPGIAVIIDSDMFLIRPFSIVDYLQNYDVGAPVNPQVRLSYLHNGKDEKIAHFLPNLMFFNMLTLPDKTTLNFNLGCIDGVHTDTGGFTHYYIKEHPNLRWKDNNMKNTALNKAELEEKEEHINYIKNHKRLLKLTTEMPFDFEFYIDYAFLHFKAGSNWNKLDGNKFNKKTSMAYEILNELLQ